MLRIIPFLGLLIGMVACRTSERVAEVGQRAEKPREILAPVFQREQGDEAVLEPKTPTALTAEQASVLAARLANDQCESRYHRRPFKPEQHRAVLREGVYHWGELDVGGHEGFSASVTFDPDGSEPHVEVYFSSDTVLGMK